MALIQRVQDILLKPKETWPVIAAEPGDTASIYTGYVMILAAIGPIAAFIGFSLIGAGAFGISVRLPLMMGLVNLIVSYVLALVVVFVMALIVNALAPTFGGTQSQANALKLVAYGLTASFVGGIFGLLPMLAILGLLAGLYSIYLVYTGLPVMMKCPPDKAGAYTAVVIVCGIVAMVVVAALSSMLIGGGVMTGGGLPGRHLGGIGTGGDVTIKTPGGEVSINTAKMEEMAKKMEAAGKAMERAQTSGDPAAAAKAMGAMLGAMGGNSGVPIAPQDLKALLPEAIGELKRESYEAQGGQGGQSALAGWANVTSEKETNEEVEKVYKQGNRTLRDQARKDGSHAEVTVILENGVLVEARGDRVDLASLKKVVEGVDLGKIEAMKRVAKQ